MNPIIRLLIGLVAMWECGLGIIPLKAATTAEHPQKSDDDSNRVATGWFVPTDTPLKRFYAGADVGAVFTDYAKSVNDGSVTNIHKGDVGTAVKVFIGYNFSDYFGLEAGYSAINNVDFSAGSDGTGNSWSAGNVSAEFEADMFDLVFVGRYPLTDRWTIIGKIGYQYWESTETFNENGFISKNSDSGSSAYVAGGFEYDLGLKNRIKLRGELGYQKFEEDNLNVIGTSLGFIYEFP